jgi:hypothetical protein
MKYLKNTGLWIVCLVLLLGVAAQSAGVEVAEAYSSPVESTQDTTDSFSIYLPSINSNYFLSNKPAVFSMQIAGLSDFTPSLDMTRAQIDQLRVQEYAALTEVFPTLVEALGKSGAGSARVYIDWAYIQSVDALTYNWDMYDSWMSQVKTAGVQIIGTISNPPAWAVDTTADPCSNKILAEQVDEFYNFITTLVNRYQVAPYNIHTWEILNEPDAIDGYRCTTGVSNYGEYGVDYSTLLQGAYLTIKTADPSAKVIMGGLAYDWFYLPYDDTIYYDGSLAGQFNRYFIDDVVTSGGANYADAVNFHYFHDFAAEWERWTVGDLPTCGDYTLRDPQEATYATYGMDLVAKGSHFLNRLKTCYGVEKPLWITEIGYHGTADPLVLAIRPEDTLDNQARYVFMIYARGLSLGAENITWYALNIIPSITPDDFQGLLYDSRDGDLENQPKPAFYAYQTLAHELTGYQYSSTLAAPSDVEGFAFTNTLGATKIIAWYNQLTETVPLNLGSANKVRLIYRPDANGNAQSVTFNDGDPTYDLDGAVDGQVTIALNLEPVIIQINP